MTTSTKNPKLPDVKRGAVFKIGAPDAFGVCINSYESGFVLSAFFLGSPRREMSRTESVLIIEHDRWGFICFGWQVVAHQNMSLEQWPEAIRLGAGMGPFLGTGLRGTLDDTLLAETIARYGLAPEVATYPLTTDCEHTKASMIPYQLAEIVLAGNLLALRSRRFHAPASAKKSGEFQQYCAANRTHWELVFKESSEILNLKMSYLEYYENFVVDRGGNDGQNDDASSSRG